MTKSSSQEDCKIEKHIFDGKSPVLVCLNKSMKAKNGRCLKCNGIRCAHVQAWNQELKKSILKILYQKNVSKVFDEEVEAENEIREIGSVEESKDFETLKDHAITERLQLWHQCPTKKCGNLIVHNLKI